MLRSKGVIGISTALLIVVCQGIVPADAVAQPPQLTREADSPIRGNRFAQRITIIFPATAFTATSTVTPDIPEGKKLFLQSVSMHLLLTHGMNPMQATVALFANPPGRLPLGTFYVDMDFQAQPVGIAFEHRQRHFTGNRDLNVVINPGETIELSFVRNNAPGGGGQNFGTITLVGYLVDAES